MASVATLQIANKPFQLLEFKVTVTRNTDETGRIAAVPRIRHLMVTISLNHDEHKIIFEKFAEKKPLDKIEVITYKVDAPDQKAVTYTYTNAYIVGYEDHFNSHNKDSQVLTLYITSEKLGDGGATFDMQWPATK